jgi:GTP-binding protein LepA
MEQSKKLNKIRNFSIIAHIDHGKSTLADRLLEETKTIEKRDMKDRMLDTLELEQERGITIKLQTARMHYKDHILNLIDTPGHVDFAFEVSRSLRASEGALLLVDATQGIQAQTFTTVYKALEYNLEIIPVINKVDLPSAEIEKTIEEMMANFAFNREEIILASGKTGKGVPEILDAIIKKIPAPSANSQENLQALVFDSFYHTHKGVVILVKVENGQVTQNDNLYFINSKVSVEPLEIGYLKPALIKNERIAPGEVGYIATGLKDIRKIHVGDTLTLNSTKQTPILEGYRPPKPMVYASIFPSEADDFREFRDALEKLALNDAALSFSRVNNQALGTGFNCGFLGLLHLEITQERLEREFDLDLVITTPSVEYLVQLTTKDISKIPNIDVTSIDDDGILHVRAAGEYPEANLVEEAKEPWSKLEILTPDDYIGEIMELAQNHRGEYIKMEYISDQMIAGQKHVMLSYNVPTSEIITDFFDKLKSITQGYASMDYEFIGYRKSDIVKVSILINKDEIDSFSFLAHRENSENRGRRLVEKLKDIIPRQQFSIPIQAAIGGKVIARATIKAYRKDVTAKLYGGDVTRKKKLLEKQKKGKKRMKQFGNIEIPKTAFIEALSS